MFYNVILMIYKWALDKRRLQKMMALKCKKHSKRSSTTTKLCRNQSVSVRKTTSGRLVPLCQQHLIKLQGKCLSAKLIALFLSHTPFFELLLNFRSVFTVSPLHVCRTMSHGYSLVYVAVISG